MEKEQEKNLNKVILEVFTYISIVHKNIIPNLEKIFKMTNLQRKIYLRKILKENAKIFSRMYEPVKKGVINAYNISSVFNSKKFKILPLKAIKEIPQTNPFRITRKYLNKASIVKRGLINSNDLNKIIEKGYQKGWGYKKTAIEIDKKLGYRDIKGKLTKGRARNGIQYQTQTIARQEIRRVDGIAQYDSYLESQKQGVDSRLRMLARLIPTSRSQSYVMNGQLDGESYGSKGGGNFNKKYVGKFQYPDGRWYIFGQAPLRWSINDRETIIPFVSTSQEKNVNRAVQEENKKGKILNLT